MEQNRHRQRGETRMVTFRMSKELLDRIPVKRAPNAGKEAGLSGYLRSLLIEAVERDLAAREEQAA